MRAPRSLWRRVNQAGFFLIGFLIGCVIELILLRYTLVRLSPDRWTLLWWVSLPLFLGFVSYSLLKRTHFDSGVWREGHDAYIDLWHARWYVGITLSIVGFLAAVVAALLKT